MLPAARLPRRTAIAAGVAGLVAVSGCDDDGSTQPDPLPSPEPDADETLVDEALAAIAGAWGLTGGRPALAAVHRAHVEALGGDPDDAPARRRVGAAVLRRHEEALRAELVSAAVAAESGALARLLASMSAAIAQQVTLL